MNRTDALGRAKARMALGQTRRLLQLDSPRPGPAYIKLFTTVIDCLSPDARLSLNELLGPPAAR